MIIPVCVDEKKDRELIEWLEEKNNRSAFIRFVLYEKMNESENNFGKNGGNRRIFGKNEGKCEEIQNEIDDIDDNFMKCIEGL